jgi:uncharacterized protein YbjT (DUF2867 family)
MVDKTFSVMGSTGHIGTALTEALLKRRCRVRAIGRDPDKLAALKAKGAEPVAAAFDDADRLAQAFSGCQGVFVMIPPDYGADDPGAFQDRVGESIMSAVVRSGVRKVVSLSSIGAQHSDRTGPVKGLHRQESRLSSLPGVDVLNLRPCYFMENLLWSIPTIRERGVVASAIRGDLPMWMVCAEDIGRKAADLLGELAFTGKSVCEFAGPTQMTQQEATRLIAAALGLPGLRYVKLDYTQFESALLASGMKPGIARLFSEMQRGFNDGLFEPTRPIGAGQRGSTTFETFARRFAAAYASQQVAA